MQTEVMVSPKTWAVYKILFNFLIFECVLNMKWVLKNWGQPFKTNSLSQN